MRVNIKFELVFSLGLAVGLLPARSATAQHTIEVEAPAQDGHLEHIEVPAPAPMTESLLMDALADVEVIQETGSSDNRIDFVFVGDGYTADDLDDYHADVINRWEELMTVEPFSTYRSYFNAYKVNVISNESGVDNDPTLGVVKDTALNMYFWCGNLDRLLCADVNAALAYANNAPAAEHVIALANSSKYGGAGYKASNLATSAGSNLDSGRIVMHELGHSLGDLGDEYIRNDGHYTGPEPIDANLSIYESAQMADLEAKWYRWLGDPTPDGGYIGTYEGGEMGTTGIYRPSQNSMMKDLDFPFNLPGREQLVVMIYADVSPIDDNTPTDVVLQGTETVFVHPMAPDGHSLTITWRLDGAALSLPPDQTTVDLSGLSLSGNHTLTATVVDNTPFVRNPVDRVDLMTDTRTWTIDADQGGPGTGCGDFGIAYVDDSTLAVFHRDEGWSANWHYLCLEGYCVPGELRDGYYVKEFSGTLDTGYGFEFKVQDDGQGQFTTSGRDTFSRQSCRLDAPSGCTSSADCDDGLYCNGEEACVDGGCVAGSPIVCDDGIACTADSCDEQSDTCIVSPDHGVCDNGLFCDGEEVCDPTGGGCSAGVAPCGSDPCDEINDICDGGSADCQEFGIAYENNNTLVVYHEDRGWTGQWHYLCLNGYCVPGTLSNGYYRKSFSGSIGTTYSIEFKVQDNTTGQYIVRGQETFTSESCVLP